LELQARIVTLPLAETFVISRESQDEVELAQVELVFDGVSGFGEAAPIGRYDQTAASAHAWLEDVDPGEDPWALDELARSLPPGEPAARSALDAALHDLQGKQAGLPVWLLLGLRRHVPPTTWKV
jgi:L-alanine-DL-glutamate epimerase-like enolase superfamily enzyme